MKASDLANDARQAARDAYCPHSNFHVGASVRTERGIYRGANVENDSFGLTICAERAAIFSAVSCGARRIVALAVTCPDAPDDAPISGRMPCGACRQVIAQFADAQTEIYVDKVGTFHIQDLLPEAFTL